MPAKQRKQFTSAVILQKGEKSFKQPNLSRELLQLLPSCVWCDKFVADFCSVTHRCFSLQYYSTLRFNCLFLILFYQACQLFLDKKLHVRPLIWPEKFSQWSCLLSEYKNTFFGQSFTKKIVLFLLGIAGFKGFLTFGFLILREISVSFLFGVLRE